MPVIHLHDGADVQADDHGDYLRVKYFVHVLQVVAWAQAQGGD